MLFPFVRRHIFFLFSLRFSAIYPRRLLWCELLHFRDIGNKDNCLLLDIMELDGSVVLKMPMSF